MSEEGRRGLPWKPKKPKGGFALKFTLMENNLKEKCVKISFFDFFLNLAKNHL